MAGNSKNFLPVFQLFSSADMSVDQVSAPTDIRYLDNISMSIFWTGTAEGTFSVEGSLNYNYHYDPLVTGTWTAIRLSPIPVAQGTPDSILLDLNQLSFPYIRLRYTATTGTGTLQAFISAKAV